MNVKCVALGSADSIGRELLLLRVLQTREVCEPRPELAPGLGSLSMESS
jgi:hypothetical protein